MKIINWLFYLILLLLLGTVNSMTIPENEHNNTNKIKDIINSIEHNSKEKDNDSFISTKNEEYLNSNKSIKEMINNKERDVNVNNGLNPYTNHLNTSTFDVDEKSVSIPEENQLSYNNSTINVDTDESDKVNYGDISIDNSDNGYYNITEDDNKVKVVEDSNNKSEEDKNKSSDYIETYKEKSKVKEGESSRSNKSNSNVINNKNIDNTSNKSPKTNNSNSYYNYQKKTMFAYGIIIGILLFFATGGIVILFTKKNKAGYVTSSSNNRSLSLDLESFDSIDLRTGDLNYSILSLETMEQYSEDEKVYVVDEGNNLKNIAKIYEIKGYKNHTFEKYDIERNQSKDTKVENPSTPKQTEEDEFHLKFSEEYLPDFDITPIVGLISFNNLVGKKNYGRRVVSWFNERKIAEEYGKQAVAIVVGKHVPFEVDRDCRLGLFEERRVAGKKFGPLPKMYRMHEEVARRLRIIQDFGIPDEIDLERWVVNPNKGCKLVNAFGRLGEPLEFY
ncbi:hypothetical protein PIROE2DRAFT_68776 [Piromyces sp. E2]|nr:hypothetical protein PIROE2DRAFT_68776 [Piromyces sp. E2]|eukprot:OUM67897.1 hypothetical protein PIROE2DRAFT_68776 [Piromyces sp. E2]